jgi:hypothetical protein
LRQLRDKALQDTTATHVPYIWCTPSQLLQVLYAKDDAKDTAKMQVLNFRRTALRASQKDQVRGSAIVAALMIAAADFEKVAASAERYRDDLLEVDVAGTLLTALQLKLEAAALERRTLSDIKAELIGQAGAQQRLRRPPGRLAT